MIAAKHFGFALNALALPSIYAFADASGVSESSPASASEQVVSNDKSHYTIFDPVPGDLLRELTPERPDKTESPYTVDAGHVQLEMDFANLTLDDSNAVRTHAWNVAPFNIKIGLLNNVEIQFVFDDYLRVGTNDCVTRTTTTQSGVGDVTPHLKINVWGNDGGPTALGFLPFVKFPTNSDQLGNNSVEGWIGTVDFGLTYAIAENVQLDCGCNAGVTCSADDLNPFSGITVRF